MTKAGDKLLRSAREALKFSRILANMPMVDAPRHTTVFVTKKGKVLGVVHGQRLAR